MEIYEPKEIAGGTINAPKLTTTTEIRMVDISSPTNDTENTTDINLGDFTGTGTSDYDQASLGNGVGGYSQNKLEHLIDYVTSNNFSSRDEKVNFLLSNMVTDSMDMVDMQINTFCLQTAIDTLSIEGGTLYLPAGTFNFAQGGTALREYPQGSGQFYDYERYAILCRNNVTIVGAGTSGDNVTILKPYDPGEVKNGTGSMDMFYFNNYSQSGFKADQGIDSVTNVSFRNDITGQAYTMMQHVYLINADFKNFIIDGSNVTGKKENYTSAGKGFMINLMANCDWDNVIVQNTDATGFGMDCPINCTINNCIAINCGKQADENQGGASGFGIGTGFSNDESIIISNCQSYNNMKYGFFFEHQSRFQGDTSIYPATSSNGFVVTNCVAGGNYADFGGVKAYDVIFDNVKSITDISEIMQPVQFRAIADTFEVETLGIQARTLAYGPEDDLNLLRTFAYKPSRKLDNIIDIEILKRGVPLAFSDYSVNCHVMNSELGNSITDVNRFEDEIYWAINKGYVYPEDSTTYSPFSTLNRLDFMEILYRYMGLPNDVNLNAKWTIGQGTYNQISTSQGGDLIFTDLNGSYTSENGGLDAVLWGVNNGIVSPDSNFNPDSPCSRSQVITMLYRLAGCPSYSITDLPFTDVNGSNDGWYQDALRWGYEVGLIKGTSETTFAPNDPLTKEQVAIFLNRFDSLMNNRNVISV